MSACLFVCLFSIIIIIIIWCLLKLFATAYFLLLAFFFFSELKFHFWTHFRSNISVIIFYVLLFFFFLSHMWWLIAAKCPYSHEKYIIYDDLRLANGIYINSQRATIWHMRNEQRPVDLDKIFAAITTTIWKIVIRRYSDLVSIRALCASYVYYFSTFFVGFNLNSIFCGAENVFRLQSNVISRFILCVLFRTRALSFSLFLLCSLHLCICEVFCVPKENHEL